jgi:hypothetical protein
VGSGWRNSFEDNPLLKESERDYLQELELRNVELEKQSQIANERAGVAERASARAHEKLARVICGLLDVVRGPALQITVAEAAAPWVAVGYSIEPGFLLEEFEFKSTGVADVFWTNVETGNVHGARSTYYVADGQPLTEERLRAIAVADRLAMKKDT